MKLEVKAILSGDTDQIGSLLALLNEQAEELVATKLPNGAADIEPRARRRSPAGRFKGRRVSSNQRMKLTEPVRGRPLTGAQIAAYEVLRKTFGENVFNRGDASRALAADLTARGRSKTGASSYVTQLFDRGVLQPQPGS